MRLKCDCSGIKRESWTQKKMIKSGLGANKKWELGRPTNRLLLTDVMS